MSLILVIDDDPTVQIVLSRALENQGHQVVITNNGEEGVTLARQLYPGLVICDWMIQQSRELDICRQIKAEPSLSLVFFIFLTNLGSVADCVQALNAGADDFITKPIDQNELTARVRAGLRLHQMSRDLQKQKQLLEAELGEAADYVRSLLPPQLQEPLTINSRFIPSRRLGGDCFDYYWLDPDYLAVYLLDTAGHGLGATLPSISVLNMLRSRALDGINYYQPTDVLRALNNTFQMTTQNSKYFTIWYGVYNRVNRQLIYANAGHPPAVLFSETPTLQVTKLDTPSIPIGMFPDTNYKDKFFQIPESSTLYIFSDGVYELHLADGSIWQLDYFIDLLRAAHAAGSCNLDNILRQLSQINSQDSFDDDLSILQIRFDN
ncbi:PP2C family protein-serine/threonine phosphatase [Gloeocapsopsis dulcis]|uniref:Regulator n=1 Tax=Gloeocapsopsis dulcis AAB1 = 1H9 TaxID=1433147 RepID=A0A6N8FTG9_9CHRO|nr:SpoIIE family protein phosphatase [Gloeocapsopsis dulcis]MUL36054.1 regulator [Gloeocapsopsis dulcis AAB1 = 1H9]WNN91477.1 SpoIIE family protein phosphatase [Gloeocapsopsis dulcis]